MVSDDTRIMFYQRLRHPFDQVVFAIALPLPRSMTTSQSSIPARRSSNQPACDARSRSSAVTGTVRIQDAPELAGCQFHRSADGHRDAQPAVAFGLSGGQLLQKRPDLNMIVRSSYSISSRPRPPRPAFLGIVHGRRATGYSALPTAGNRQRAHRVHAQRRIGSPNPMNKTV